MHSSYISEKVKRICGFFRTFPRTTLVLILVFIFFYAGVISPPRDFPENSLFSLKEGSTLRETARLLEEKNIIRSSLLFEVLVRGTPIQNEVVSGDYFFDTKKNVFRIALQVTAGTYALRPIQVTIPEGNSVREISSILKKRLPEFDAEEFLFLAQKDEGYLFPDTYFFLPNTKAEEVQRVMRKNFEDKINPILADVQTFGHPLHDVVTMASLLEEEARTSETRRIIAGILWKRLEQGMPLQVDAVFSFIKGTYIPVVSLDDLTVDSPYNTYKYKGLPPGPITNPGLDSIQAAVNPTPSQYWYYLSDKEGNMHYSKTFEEHKIKKAKYIP